MNKDIESLKESFNNILKTYEFNIMEIERLNNTVIDLTHEIELSKDKTVSNGYKIYKRLRNILRERRDRKNENEYLKTMYEHIIANKSVFNKINNIAGEIKFTKTKLDNRVYKPRELELSCTSIKPASAGKFDDLLKKFNKECKSRRKYKYK